MLEVCDDFFHLGFAFKVELSNLILFDFSPVSVLSMLILLEYFIELPEQVGIDVSEQASHNLHCCLVDVSFQLLHKVTHFILVALEAVSQHLFAIKGQIPQLIKVRYSYLFPKSRVQFVDWAVDDFLYVVLGGLLS